MRTSSIVVFFLGALITNGCVSGPDETGESGQHARFGMPTPAPTASTPLLSTVSRTETTIIVRVCAGATGAPAGFSLQWMTAADFAGYGNVWPEYTEEGREFCKASFSGMARDSRFALDPDGCADVEMGNLSDTDAGLSYTCNSPLACGTEYVFRAFAHANSTVRRSEFTAAFTASTLACPDLGCTYTQGYWRNHADTPGWPANCLMLGTVGYDRSQLLAIYGASVAGNGLISLAHQLVAAKLNIANGADATEIAAAITSADALIGGLIVPPIGTGWLAPRDTSALNDQLTRYNEGVTGPGHCESSPLPSDWIGSGDLLAR